MKSTFTKITALILSAALMFSANDVISFAQGGQNLREIAVADENDGENQGDSGEDGQIEKAEESGLSSSDPEESQSTSSNPDESQSSSSDPDESNPPSTNPPSTDPDESESPSTELQKFEITNIKLVDTANNEEILKNDDNKYYTSKSALTAEIDIVNGTDKEISLEVDGKKCDDYDGKSGIYSYAIVLSAQEENKINFKLINEDSVIEECITIVYDATSPEMQIQHMAGDDNRILHAEPADADSQYKLYTNSREFRVELEASDSNSGIAAVQIKIGDIDVELQEQENKYSYDFTNIGDNQIITYAATDKTGNCKEVVYKVYFNDEAPEMQIQHKAGDDNHILNVEPADADADSQYKLYTNSRKFRVELEASDSNPGIAAVQAKVGGIDVDLQKEENKYSYEFTNIEDKQVITYTATDKAGNCKEAVYEICFNDEAPDMEIQHVIEGENRRTLFEESIGNKEKKLYTNKTDFMVELKVTDDASRVEEVHAIVGTDKKVLQMKDGAVDEYFYNLADVEDGQVIKYIVTDKAGNRKESSVYKVCVDNKNPKWGMDGDAIELKDNRTISVQAQDDKSGINRIYIEEEDNDFSAGNEKNEYTFALDDKIIQEIKNKNIEILKRKIVLEDKAGNKEEKEFNLLFDFTAPEIRIVVSKDGDGKVFSEGPESDKVYYTTTNCTLEIEVEDKKKGGYNSGAQTFKIKDVTDDGVGANYTCKEGINKYKISCQFKDQEEGEKKYEFTVKDKMSNIYSCKVEIIYDTQEPQIRIDGLKKLEGASYYNQPDVSVQIIEKNFIKDTEGKFDKNELKLEIVDLGNNQKYLVTDGWDQKGDKTNICTFDMKDGVYKLNARCKDKLGNEKVFSIDKLIIDTKEPEVSIEYGLDEEKGKTHYNKSATIQVTDKNFDDNCNWEVVELGSEKKYKDLKWEKGEKLDTYFSTIQYEDEGTYQFKFSCSDKAGNKNGEGVVSDQIIIDHTAPQITVSLDDKKPVSGNVYKVERVATVTIEEQNFEGQNVEIVWTGAAQKNDLPKLSKWESAGIIHTATISFKNDGKYEFKIKCTDNAGNERESQKIEEFIIDREAPVIKVEYPSGYNAQAENQFSKEPINIKVTVVDDNFDEMSGLQIIKQGASIEPKTDRKSPDGNVFVYDVSMQDDGEYKFDISAKDKAGNETTQECVRDTTIDRTRPKIDLTFTDEGAKNQKYYKKRTATIKITEMNFDESKVVLEPVGASAALPAISGWSGSGGDIHMATLEFDKDGIYNFVVKCTDIAGNEQDKVGESHEFIIDQTNPTVKIEYDKDSPVNEKYHNAFRTAKVIVTDENFDEKCTMKFDITSDGDKPQIGKWTKSGASGSSQYTCEVFFDKDGEYSFKFSCEDLAGNKSNVENGGSFVIDTTKPEISVTYDNNNAKNGKYYNNSRTATITIKDKAFADNLVSVESLNPSGGNGLPSMSAWTASGDTHTAKISFMEDGSYGFRVKCTDLADNAAKDYLGEVFIIDRSAPEVVFGGVRKNSANNGVAAPTLKCTDAYLDEAGTQIILTGTNHGQLSGIAQKSTIKDGIQMVYPDFEHTQDMDDFYTLTVKAVDLAGNETEDELNFSINRFGSTYRISTDTQKLVSGYYIGKAPTITVTEINIDELEYGEVTISKDGQTVTLRQGSDYAVAKEGEEENWKSYTYSIKPGNFAKDGVYSVGFYSKDKASNTSDNRIKGKEIEFALDTTAPSIVADGIESGMTYNEKSREVTVDVKDNMFLTRLTVTDNDETLVDMSESELAENGGIVTFTLGEADGLRDVVITAMDKVNNVQKLEFLDVLITSKKEVITTIENEKAVADTEENIVKPVAGAGIVLPSYDEDDSLLYMVIEVMSAAVLITAVVTFYRKKRKIRK